MSFASNASTSSEYSSGLKPVEIVVAASWVDLRTRFPPNGGDIRYLKFQGVKSLIWGRNTWSAALDGISYPK